MDCDWTVSGETARIDQVLNAIKRDQGEAKRVGMSEAALGMSEMERRLASLESTGDSWTGA